VLYLIIVFYSIPLINIDKISDDFKGDGQTICLIDSGVDKTHMALSGKVIGEHCFCSERDGLSPHCCPNNSTEQNGDESALDNNGHGTHVAGIIVSDDISYRGVAPNSKIVAVKILNSTGKIYPYDISSAINWCVSNKNKYHITIISLSLGEGAYTSQSNCDQQSESLAASKEIADTSAPESNRATVSNLSFPSSKIGIEGVLTVDPSGLLTLLYLKETVILENHCFFIRNSC